MQLTQEQIEREGYQLKAAPIDDWRTYDEDHPIPGYFQFDWLSARHPDLYHAFALSTLGLMHELDKLMDLSGLDVVDIGAGTGRSAIEAARISKKVTAIDRYESVIAFGKDRINQAQRSNVAYIRGDRGNLPCADNSFDACTCVWAEMDYPEAYRVLKPNGYLIQLGAAPGALCGELTATLADQYPGLITEIAPADQYDSTCPAEDFVIQDASWNGLSVTPPILCHHFTYTSDYGDYQEAAVLLGRLYGPKARQYMLDRQQSLFGMAFED